MDIRLFLEIYRKPRRLSIFKLTCKIIAGNLTATADFRSRWPLNLQLGEGQVHVKNYKTLDDVIKNLPMFIDEIYNEERLHSALDYMPPNEFEAEILKMKPADRPVQKLYGYAV